MLPHYGLHLLVHQPVGCQRFAAENRVKAKNASATISLDLSDDIRLRSITGYSDFKTSNRSDGDGSPIPFSEFYFITKACFGNR